MKDRTRIPIRKAAKAVGRDYRLLRQLIEIGKLRAWKVGGTDASPWLEVYVDEVEAALDRHQLYVPPAPPEPRKRRRKWTNVPMDPAAANM